MSDIKFWGWNKKPRTMLRYLKTGDIFCFQISDGKFGFGKIVSKVSVGHSAEIFDYFSHSPDDYDIAAFNSDLKSMPVILDSYSLFDKKISGEWRIIGHEEGGKVKQFENIYFVYGSSGERKKVDMYGNTTEIADKASESYPPYMPKNDYHIKNMLSHLSK